MKNNTASANAILQQQPQQQVAVPHPGQIIGQVDNQGRIIPVQNQPRTANAVFALASYQSKVRDIGLPVCSAQSHAGIKEHAKRLEVARQVQPHAVSPQDQMQEKLRMSEDIRGYLRDEMNPALILVGRARRV